MRKRFVFHETLRVFCAVNVFAIFVCMNLDFWLCYSERVRMKDRTMFRPFQTRFYANPVYLTSTNSTLTVESDDADLFDHRPDFQRGTNVNRIRPTFPIDAVPVDKLVETFGGSMSHGLSVRPFRFDPPCCPCGVVPMDFEIAATTFGPRIGEARINVPMGCQFPGTSRFGSVRVTLPDTSFQGVVGFHKPCDQKRITIVWNETNAENSFRTEPFCPPCCFSDPIRLGHIGTIPLEERNNHFVRYWDSQRPRYSTCRSWIANSPYVLPVILSFQGLLKVAHFFGFGCQYIETISAQCEDCDWGKTWKAVRQCEISRICARKNMTSYRPLSHRGVRAAVNDQYGIKLYTIYGDDEESDLSTFGHVRVLEDGKFEYGCIYKRFHLDPTDIGKLADGPSDVASFDVYFRGSVDANALEKADLELVLGYVLTQAMTFEFYGGTSMAMQMTLPYTPVQFKSLVENSRAPQGQEMR